MVDVRMTDEACCQFDRLPKTIKARVATVFSRLAHWPNVSGAKPLSGNLAGYYRIRTGDWRVLFRLVAAAVLVVRIAHRSEVYED
jgi:mRNA interferase RelE/StbE